MSKIRDPELKMCNMSKLYVNTATGEKINPYGANEVIVLKEHCDPKLFY